MSSDSFAISSGLVYYNKYDSDSSEKIYQEIQLVKQKNIIEYKIQADINTAKARLDKLILAQKNGKNISNDMILTASLVYEQSLNKLS